MGHLFRAINIYRELKRNNLSAVVVVIDGNPESINWLSKNDIFYELFSTAETDYHLWESMLISKYNANVWIDDRIETNFTHASRVKLCNIKLVTLDDSGEGATLADLHIAPLLFIRGKPANGKKVITDINYLILSPEIERYRRNRVHLEKIVVCLGGSDTYGVTINVINWLNFKGRNATVILGPSFKHWHQLDNIDLSHIKIKKSVDSLIEEFYLYDLAITGGGITAFEAAASGLPTLTIANESWEIFHCNHLERLGCSVFCGHHNLINFQTLDLDFNIQKLSVNALNFVTPVGVTKFIKELRLLVAQ